MYNIQCKKRERKKKKKQALMRTVHADRYSSLCAVESHE